MMDITIEKSLCVCVCKMWLGQTETQQRKVVFFAVADNLKSDVFDFCCFGLIFPIAECGCSGLLTIISLIFAVV